VVIIEKRQPGSQFPDQTQQKQQESVQYFDKMKEARLETRGTEEKSASGAEKESFHRPRSALQRCSVPDLAGTTGTTKAFDLSVLRTQHFERTQKTAIFSAQVTSRSQSCQGTDCCF
jgi:hypothetical protein